MTNDIVTSVDLMVAATDLDDANEQYRAALVRVAAARSELAAAETAEIDASRTRDKAARALVDTASTNPLTDGFWENPLA